MTATAEGISTQTDDAAAQTLLAALDPGTFGQDSTDSRPMGVKEHTLSQAEGHLRPALALFEQMGEHRLADALETLILRVIDRMGEVAQEGAAA